MKDVVDPELGINVVDLGLVYGVHVDEAHNCVLDMTLTSAACPLTDVIQDQTNSALEGLVNDVAINWVWMPPWGPDKITEDGREQLRALASNVGAASRGEAAARVSEEVEQAPRVSLRTRDGRV